MNGVDTMQFRDYIFNHNPQRVTVSAADNVVTHLCPGGAEISQHLGARARVVTCTGSFFGDSFADAMRQLEQFQRKASGGGTGILFVPGIAPFFARLTDFTFNAEDDGRIIPYTMHFIEAVNL